MSKTSPTAILGLTDSSICVWTLLWVPLARTTSKQPSVYSTSKTVVTKKLMLCTLNSRKFKSYTNLNDLSTSPKRYLRSSMQFASVLRRFFLEIEKNWLFCSAFSGFKRKYQGLHTSTLYLGSFLSYENNAHSLPSIVSHLKLCFACRGSGETVKMIISPIQVTAGTSFLCFPLNTT